MNNKAIIRKLKEQAQDLIDNIYTDDDKLRNWVDKTKVYILGLWLDKKDEYFKKEVIKMLEEYKGKIPHYPEIYFNDPDEEVKETAKEILTIQGKLQNILEPFIEIVEIREKALESEENITPEELKKSKTKRKSD